MTAESTMPITKLTLGPGEGRTPEPLNIIGEETVVKVTPADSDGQMAFFHLTVPPMTGPALHSHSREDELFYVLEGELVFEADGERFTAVAGSTVYLRRGVAHRYQNFTNETARLLIVTTPGEFCRFFEELSAATPAGALPDPAMLDALAAQYGITTLGPPMTA
jgi:quercetin dioxygenase-like cupin family protein